MALSNNLATFRIVNDQLFIFVYKIIPLETNLPSVKDSDTEIKVTFPFRIMVKDLRTTKYSYKLAKDSS